MKRIGKQIGTLMRLSIVMSLLWLMLAWFNSGIADLSQLVAYTWPLILGWALYIFQRVYKKNRLPLYFSIAYILVIIISVVREGNYYSWHSILHFFPWGLFDKYTWYDRWNSLVIGLFIIWGLAWITLSIPDSYKLSFKKLLSAPYPAAEADSSKFISKRKVIFALVLFLSLGMGNVGKILYKEYQKKHIEQIPMPLNAPAPVPAPAPVDLMSEGWYRFSPGNLFGPSSNSGISFISPCVPEYSKVDALEKAGRRVKQYEHYTCNTKDFYVIYYWVSYKRGVKVDPNEPLTTLSKQFHFKTKLIQPTTIDKLTGQVLNGTYETAKGSGAIKCVVIADKSEVWSIILNYRRNDSAAENSAQRIIGSISFLRMPEPLTLK